MFFKCTFNQVVTFTFLGSRDASSRETEALHDHVLRLPPTTSDLVGCFGMTINEVNLI